MDTANNVENSIPNEWIEITPEDSFGPIYSVDLEISSGPEFDMAISPDEMIANNNANKQSAINKLKALGLTEDEAKAIIGV